MVSINNKYISFWEKGLKSLPASEKSFKKLENVICVKLPEFYVKCMKVHDGGYIAKDCFLYYDIYKGLQEKGSIGKKFKISSGEESVLEDLINPPEFFQKGLIPFADDGGGNLTCFDYRKTKKDPPIVFWVHDDPEGEDIHFVANNFEEFVNMLYEPLD